MRTIQKVLEATYDNPKLRRTTVPLFIGDPGLGKTVMIDAFAKSRGARIVEFITSQRNPFEISGIAMPDRDTKKMSIWDFDEMSSLKDGDILFFDEVLNGNPTVLNACLTLLESRKMISGRTLPDIMIIAAANPQGMVPITPQIKERFIWYPVKFDAGLWKDYMNKTYNLPYSVTNALAQNIKDEDFKTNNFNTPRSITKAYEQYLAGCPTPYKDVLEAAFNTYIVNKSNDRTIRLNKHITLEPGSYISYKYSLLGKAAKEKIITDPPPVNNGSKEYSIFFKSYATGKKMLTRNYLRKEFGWSIEDVNNILNNSKEAEGGLYLTKTSYKGQRDCKRIFEQLESIDADVVKVYDPVFEYKVIVTDLGRNITEAKAHLKQFFGMKGYELKKKSIKKGLLINTYVFKNDADIEVNRLQEMGISCRKEEKQIEIKD